MSVNDPAEKQGRPERVKLAPAVADAVRRAAAIEGVSVAELVGRALGLYFQAQGVWQRGGKLLIEHKSGGVQAIGEPQP